jgi:hypothetical protein
MSTNVSKSIVGAPRRMKCALKNFSENRTNNASPNSHINKIRFSLFRIDFQADKSTTENMLSGILLSVVALIGVADAYTCYCYCPYSSTYSGSTTVSLGTCSTSNCVSACIASPLVACTSNSNTYA